MPLCNDIVKNREIRFKLTTPDQAGKAKQLLTDVAGIEQLEASEPNCLHIRYNVEVLTLQMIESALQEVGFELDDGLITRMKRAVFSYCEEAIRSSIGIDDNNASKRQSLSLPHHTHEDPRSYDWRKHV